MLCQVPAGSRRIRADGAYHLLCRLARRRTRAEPPSSVRFEHPPRDFVLAGEPDAGITTRVVQELSKCFYPRGTAGHAIVASHHQHAPPRLSFSVQHVELIFQQLQKRPGGEALDLIADKIIYMERVRHGHERLTVHLLDERVVAAN